jgi:hypothetical protein
MARRIFIAEVHGEYISVSGDNKILKSYRATFRLPDASAPLGMIKGKLLMPFLKKLDMNAVAPYSWYLDEIRPEHGVFDPDELPVLFQTAAQLQEYCKRHKLHVPVEEYGSLEIARQHVMLAKEDPKAFDIIFAKYQTTMLADRELAELNQGFEGIGTNTGEVEVDPLTGSVTAKPSAKKVKAPKPVVEDDESEDPILS